MDRRQVLKLVGGIGSALAGCLSRPRSENSTETDSRTTTPCALPDLPTVASVPPRSCDETAWHNLEQGLKIRAGVYSAPLEVILTRNRFETPVFVRRYPADTGIIDLDEEMRNCVDYGVIIRSECDVLWRRLIAAHEACDLQIRSDGTIETQCSIV